MSEAPHLSDRVELRRLLWLAIPVAIVLWLGRDVLGPFVVAVALAYAFTPLVDRVMARTGWPRLAVVGAGYALALAALAAAAWVVGRPLIDEVRLFIADGPAAISLFLRELLGGNSVVIGGAVVPVDQLARALRDLATGFVQSPAGAFHLVARVGAWLVDVIVVLIVTFYLLLDGLRAWTFILEIVPEPERGRVGAVAARVHDVLGRWLRGQLLLIVLVAIVLYLALGPVLHLPFALALAILSGILEVVPLLGPVLAAGLAMLVAFGTGGPGPAIAVLVVYTIVREVEDQVVMPVVIGRAVHLHPAVTIFAVLVGLSAFGILGGLLAVPAAAALNVTLRELELLGPTPGPEPGAPPWRASGPAPAPPGSGGGSPPAR